MYRLALALLVAPVSIAQQVAAPDRYREARAAITRLVENGDTPALSVAVLEDDRIVWAEGFGMADIARRRRADADTIYRLASISKPFTATAMMTLVDAGKLELDVPVNRYLTDCAVTAYRGVATDVTLRRLCNHTAGLPTHWNFFYADHEPPPRSRSIREHAFCAWPPGRRTNYSNLAFGIVDHVVATAAETDFASYLRRAVLEPLGMTHTALGVPDGKADHAAVGYLATREEPGFQPVVPYGFDHDGASAVWSSVRDLMQFARLWIHDGAVDGVRVLRPESAVAMQTRMARSAGSNYGIAWGVGRVRGHRRLAHTGGMPGVSTALQVFPGRKAAVAVLTNTSKRGATQQAIRAVLPVLLPQPPAAGSERVIEEPRAAATEESVTEHAALPLEFAFRGLVAHPAGPLPMVVRRAEGRLGITLDGDPVLGLREHDGEPHLLRARFRATLATTPGAEATPMMKLDLVHEADGGLRGVMYATATRTCSVPYWVELQPEPRDRLTTDALRVISYNVLVGWRDSQVGRFLPGAQRRVRTAAWLAAQRPDVVAFQEMNGFTHESLAVAARAWGHEHTALVKEDGYPVALTSRTPIENVARVRETLDGRRLHHGMLHARTAGIDVVVVHSPPQSGTARKLHEMARALACVKPALEAGTPALIAGDFNCIAKPDVPRYDEAAHERYRKWKWHLDEGRPAEFALQPLRDAGMVEVVEAAGSLPAAMSLPRIDFVFATAGLAARRQRAVWSSMPELLRWSDHPPVVVDFSR